MTPWLCEVQLFVGHFQSWNVFQPNAISSKELSEGERPSFIPDVLLIGDLFALSNHDHVVSCVVYHTGSFIMHRFSHIKFHRSHFIHRVLHKVKHVSHNHVLYDYCIAGFSKYHCKMWKYHTPENKDRCPKNYDRYPKWWALVSRYFWLKKHGSVGVSMLDFGGLYHVHSILVLLPPLNVDVR